MKVKTREKRGGDAQEPMKWVQQCRLWPLHLKQDSYVETVCGVTRSDISALKRQKAGEAGLRRGGEQHPVQMGRTSSLDRGQPWRAKAPVKTYRTRETMTMEF